MPFLLEKIGCREKLPSWAAPEMGVLFGKMDNKTNKEIKRWFDRNPITEKQTPQCTSLEEALETVERALPGKRDMALLAMAVYISRLVDLKTPLWLMFVGVPSSAKTEIARMLTYALCIYFLDSLTENAFVSGSKTKTGEEPKDLLPLLDDKCFVIKDFTTTLSQREESVRKILGDLTSIYDDSFAKHSPVRGTIEYHAFFSLLCCVTPQALNRHQRYMNQIGPRFLFYRVPASIEEEVNKGLEVLWSSEDSRSRVREAQEKVSSYCNYIEESISEKRLEKESKEVISYLNNLAKFIARARGMVLTRNAEFVNKEGETISFYEPVEIQIEDPYRALLQLRVLARSLATVKGKSSVAFSEMDLVKQVALSSMPADRSLLLSVIAREHKDWTAKEIADDLGISHKTALRQLDELVSLKVVVKSEGGLGLAHIYRIIPVFESLLYSSTEFMSHPPTETQTPQEIVVASDKTSDQLTDGELLNIFHGATIEESKHD